MIQKAFLAKSPKGEEKRQEIERVARSILISDGYAGVSLRMIASKLEISVGNLQYYFPTKDDLVEAIITRETQNLTNMLNDFAWGPGDVQASTRQAVEVLINYYAGEAGRMYAITESLALHDPRYNKLKKDGYAYVLGHIEQLIGFALPDMATNKRAGLAQVLVALIDGASLQAQSAGYGAGSEGLEFLTTNVSKAIEHLLESWE